MEDNHISFAYDLISKELQKANDEKAIYFGRMVMAENRVKQLEQQLAQTNNKKP